VTVTDRRELKRMWRVVDQMTTAHAVLRDRYRAWSLALTLTILALSIAATALGFAGEPEVSIILTARLPVFVGALTCVIFFLTLVDLQFDWRSRARSHSDAAAELARLKTLLRDATSRLNAGEDVDLADQYQSSMDGLVEIPDRKFLRMKARHWRKVEISKRISAQPETPVWLHRLRLLLEGLGLRQRPQQPGRRDGEQPRGDEAPSNGGDRPAT
jgi:hypothetical protein